MTPQTFIFLGSSGSGKGTQAERMRSYLKDIDPDRPVVNLVMGDLFRAFWRNNDHTHKLSRAIMEKGHLQPSFLQIWLWSGFFMNNLTGTEHIIIDGTPRRIEDAYAMDSAFRFYERDDPHVVFLNLSRSEARDRLIRRSKTKNDGSLRALEDADIERIDGRLDWYEEYALPAIEFFREKPYYTFVEVNAAQSIDGVRQSIMSNISLYDHT